jgi:phage-related protein
MVHEIVEPHLKPFPIRFWVSATGREPVREFLKEQSKPDRMRLGEDLRKLQFGWPIGMPLVRKLHRDLWELRSSMPSKREIRLIFVSDGKQLILIHGFIKKTQKTPISELGVAEKRLKEMTS